MSPSIEKLAQELREAALQISTAQERAEERDLVVAAYETVERVAQDYKDLLASLPPGEHLKVERTLGRRLVDLRRSASLLPRIGTIPTSTPDRRVDGASEVGERRITGISWGAGNRPGGPANTLRVGGDVEAWCGPCGGTTTHSIIAMVGSTPRQVVCQACDNRHSFRTTPARKIAGASQGGGDRPSAPPSGGSKPLDKRAEEKRALTAELNAATDARTFDPKERYKTGEIIYHPEFGRGKVETVLRASVLVRFTGGSIKPLMLV